MLTFFLSFDHHLVCLAEHVENVELLGKRVVLAVDCLDRAVAPEASQRARIGRVLQLLQLPIVLSLRIHHQPQGVVVHASRCLVQTFTGSACHCLLRKDSRWLASIA